jgi:hypothetical protein|tara:strand:+ start:751 stop:1089 length:339 start_codon:yes stop_codon:yes gene_type:complete
MDSEWLTIIAGALGIGAAMDKDKGGGGGSSPEEQRAFFDRVRTAKQSGTISQGLMYQSGEVTPAYGRGRNISKKAKVVTSSHFDNIGAATGKRLLSSNRGSKNFADLVRSMV